MLEDLYVRTYSGSVSSVFRSNPVTIVVSFLVWKTLGKLRLLCRFKLFRTGFHRGITLFQVVISWLKHLNRHINTEEGRNRLRLAQNLVDFPHSLGQ